MNESFSQVFPPLSSPRPSVALPLLGPSVRCSLRAYVMGRVYKNISSRVTRRHRLHLLFFFFFFLLFLLFFFIFFFF